MGYMGFGMQRWIYTQKPRTAFLKQRKLYQGKIGDLNDHFHPVTSTPGTRGERMENMRKAYQAERITQGVIGLVVLVLVVWLLCLSFL